MKIVILADDFPPRSLGGAGFSTYKLAIGLKNAGHTVSVITTCREKKDEGKTNLNDLTVYTIESNYHARWRAYKSLYNSKILPKAEAILKEIQPDVVHANNIHTHLSYHSLALGMQYAKVTAWTARDVMSFNYGKLKTENYLKNLNYKTTWIDHIKLARKRWNPFRNFIIRKYLRQIDLRFAVSYALQDALVANGIKNVEVIHTGALVEEWQVSQEEKDLYKEKFGVKDKKVILFGGRLSAAKGGDKAIIALSEVVKKAPDTVMLVAGKIDEYTEKMQHEAEKMGLGGKLIFTGWISEKEMKYAYAVADVVLVPSIIFDSLPRLVIEAMAAGKAVVATHYGGAREVVQDSVNGFVIDPHDTGEMAEKILTIITDSKKIREFGEAGKEKIQKEFNTDEMIKKTIDRYTSCVENKNNAGTK